MDRCLFLDDWDVARTEGLERRPHPAERYAGNPLFVKQFPWERERAQTFLDGSVHMFDRVISARHLSADENLLAPAL